MGIAKAEILEFESCIVHHYDQIRICLLSGMDSDLFFILKILGYKEKWLLLFG